MARSSAVVRLPHLDLHDLGQQGEATTRLQSEKKAEAGESALQLQIRDISNDAPGDQLDYRRQLLSDSPETGSIISASAVPMPEIRAPASTAGGLLLQRLPPPHQFFQRGFRISQLSPHSQSRLAITQQFRVGHPQIELIAQLIRRIDPAW